jgi:outer membrane receptor protein involved in Fe transport
METSLSPYRGLSFSLTLLAAALSGVPVAMAEAEIEEIVVLGAESDAASDFGDADSVTGFGAEDLAALGAQSIADLASFTPNLEIVTAGATTPTFFIRGVGLNDFNPNSTGAVSIYQDDVAINAPAIQLGSLFDVEAVNILRGPQGSGLARNSSAGAIKLYTKKPSGEFGGFLRADFGNFEFQDYEGAVEAPIWEDLLAGRFAFRLSKRDGTMKNNCGDAPAFSDRVPFPSGGALPVNAPWSICGEPVADTNAISDIPVGLDRYVNNTDNWAARGTLLFQPTLDMTWLVNAHGARRDEISRLGQSIGTGGNFCVNGEICAAPFRDANGNPIPPSERGSASNGLLGGTVNGTSTGTNYSPREIRNRLAELAPCTAILSGPGSCASSPFSTRALANRARVQLANELASELDPEPWEGDFNHTGPTTNDNWGGYLKGDMVLPWGLELSTTSGYDTYDRLIDIDLDFSPETLFQIKTEDTAWQYYQDLAVKGQLADGRVRWEVGGWYLQEHLDVTVNNDFGDLNTVGVIFRDYTQKTKSSAGFGHLAFDFWRDFTLDGGFRYNWEMKEFDLFQIEGTGTETQQTVDETWQEPTGTVRLTYRFREDTQAFWKYTRGWKPGTFNATAASRTGITTAEPEKIDSFETGLRGSWFQGRFGIDASFFYYAYTDYQIFTAQQFLGGNPEFVILNANDAEVYGTEVDATARPWTGAFWNVRFSWLESQFLDFLKTDQFLASRGGQDNIIFKETQNSGNSLLNSPRFKVSITGEQTFPLGRYGSLTYRYDGVWSDITYYDPTEGVGLGNEEGFKFLPSDTIAQKAFWLHNMRLSWRAPGGRFEIAGWIRNLEDTAYKTFAFDGSTFRKTTIYFVGDPRTYGLSTTVSF